MVNLMIALSVNVSQEYVNHMEFKINQKTLEVIHYIELVLNKFPNFMGYMCVRDFSQIVIYHEQSNSWKSTVLNSFDLGILKYKLKGNKIHINDADLGFENICEELNAICENATIKENVANDMVDEINHFDKKIAELNEKVDREFGKINEKLFDLANKIDGILLRSQDYF